MSVVRRFGYVLAAVAGAAATAVMISQAVAAADDPSGPDDNVLDVVDSVLSDGTDGATPTTETPPPPVS